MRVARIKIAKVITTLTGAVAACYIAGTPLISSAGTAARNPSIANLALVISGAAPLKFITSEPRNYFKIKLINLNI